MELSHIYGNPQLSAIPKAPISERNMNIITSKDEVSSGGSSHKISLTTPMVNKAPVTTAPPISTSLKATDVPDHPVPEQNSLLDYLDKDYRLWNKYKLYE